MIDDSKSGYKLDLLQPPSTELIDKIFSEVKKLNSDCITKITILTFDDIKRYYKTKTPKVINIEKAGVYKKNHPEGYLVMLFFINSENEIATDTNNEMYGRIILTEKIDNKLEKIFSNNDLVTLK